MGKESTVGIVMPARNEWHLAQSGGLLEEVLKEVPRDLKPTIYICANNSNPEFVNQMRDVSSQDDRLRVIDLGETKPLTWSYAYLHGLSVAGRESDYVVEMDGNGSHDPAYIPEFISLLKRGNDAALSTRFSDGGSAKKYPWQRQMISRTGTILANLTLGLGQYVSDMTSGYEAFKGEILGNLFSKYDISKWISVTRGPGHFYQTEMRARLIWNGNTFGMIPIVWGVNRAYDPVQLPLKTLLSAFQSLIVLRSMKKSLVK